MAGVLPLLEAHGLAVAEAVRDDVLDPPEESYTPFLDDRVAVRSRLLSFARFGLDGRPRPLCAAGVLLRDHGDAARIELRRMRDAEPGRWLRAAGEMDEVLARAGVPEGEQGELFGGAT